MVTLTNSETTMNAILVGLEDDPDSSLEDKLKHLQKLHAKWQYKDTNEVVDETKLDFWQKTRYGSIVFGFALHEGQIDAIWTLFYEHRDLLLFAKTGFRKTLILQVLLFVTSTTRVVLVLMPLKLLQAEQSTIINKKASKRPCNFSE